jgi:hypothetical protein
MELNCTIHWSGTQPHALQALATSQRLGVRCHASRHLWPRA